MAWYKTGTITLTKNSTKVVGVNTKWADNLSGVSAGRMLVIPNQGNMTIYEIASVQSNTELTLASAYTGTTVSSSSYAIPAAPSVSIEQFALELSSTLAFYQSQLDGWQQILTGTGDITLTAPNGEKVTIKSQQAITEMLNNSVKKNQNVVIDKSNPQLNMYNPSGQGISLKLKDDNAFEFLYKNDETWSLKCRYAESTNSLYFFNLDGFTINGKEAVKQGDHGLGGKSIVDAGDGSYPKGCGFIYLPKDAVASPEPSIPLVGLNIISNSDQWGGQLLLRDGTTSPRVFVRTIGHGEFKGSAEFITSANSTIDSNGFLKSASPILRLYAKEPEVVEGYTQAGYGLVNSEAQGVYAKKIGIGHYEIHGSLGFAKEGWYVEQPKDANGNVFSFVEYSTDENNVITVKTYKKKFDYETCNIVAGESVDIKEGRWIDLRLEMPVVEIDEPILPIASTLNPVITD